MSDSDSVIENISVQKNNSHKQPPTRVAVVKIDIVVIATSFRFTADAFKSFTKGQIRQK